jgi:hypothetical protein
MAYYTNLFTVETYEALLAIPHVGHMADTVLEEYEDRAD